MVGIYKITSPSGKIYIGQSWKLEARKNKYKLGKCKGQTKVYNSLIKYGWNNHIFEIIHELPLDISQVVLDSYEILYWRCYLECGFKMLNIKEPGRGGKHSDSSKQKMRDSHLGVRKSNKTKERMSKAKKGVKLPVRSKEHSSKISTANLGKKHTPEAIEKIRKAGLGKRSSPESYLKGIETKRRNRTLKHSEEAKAKMRKPKTKLISPE
jgi:hypothetical protein